MKKAQSSPLAKRIKAVVPQLDEAVEAETVARRVKAMKQVNVLKQELADIAKKRGVG